MFSSYHSDSKPLGYFRGYAIHLAMALVAVHVFMMLVGVASRSAIMEALAFSVHDGWQLWRWVTYPFIHGVSFWFVIEMFFLYQFGTELEKVFGWKVFGALYVGLALLPALLVTCLSFWIPSFDIVLVGTGLSGFCVFLGFCFLQPAAVFFGGFPWLTAKMLGSISFGVYVLMDLAQRDWLHLLLFVSNCGLTYAVLRKAGLPERFEAISDGMAAALPRWKPRARPRLTVMDGPETIDRSKRRIYEPKIKPKVALSPEKKAVGEIDDLLEKISRSGLDSLTPGERAALLRASSQLNNE